MSCSTQIPTQSHLNQTQRHSNRAQPNQTKPNRTQPHSATLNRTPPCPTAVYMPSHPRVRTMPHHLTPNTLHHTTPLVSTPLHLTSPHPAPPHIILLSPTPPASQPHPTTRCVTPNAERRPSVVDQHHLLQQLRSSGVMDAARATRSTFPCRLSYQVPGK